MMKTALQNNRVRNALLLLYVLAVLVFSAAARADDGIMNYPLLHRSLASQSTKDVMGLVQVADDGTAFLVISEDVFYQLESKNVDLASFDGRKVEVKGFEVTQQVGPVYQNYSMIPLTNEDLKDKPADVLVVLQIRELFD